MLSKDPYRVVAFPDGSETKKFSAVFNPAVAAQSAQKIMNDMFMDGFDYLETIHGPTGYFLVFKERDQED